MIKWDLYQVRKAGSPLENQLIHHINRLKKTYMIVSIETEKYLTKLNSHS